MSIPPVYAILPAAGRSRRMGRDKQLIGVAGRPLLLRVIEQMEASTLTGITIVTRHAIARELGLDRIDASPLASRRCFMALNEVETSDMIDSLRIGLRAWRQRMPIDEKDGFLVAPADMPNLLAADIDACIAAYRTAAGRIFVARHAGRPGHPLIFPAALGAAVESSLCDRGLNALLAAYSDLVTYVDRPTDGVRRDWDRPSDLPKAGL